MDGFTLYIYNNTAAIRITIINHVYELCVYTYMYLPICPHKHTHTISFFYTYNKEISKITFLKLKIQELFQALTHSASAFSFQQTKFEVTLCGGRGRLFCVWRRVGMQVCCFCGLQEERLKDLSVCLFYLNTYAHKHTYTHTSTLATIFQTLRTLKVLGWLLYITSPWS